VKVGDLMTDEKKLLKGLQKKKLSSLEKAIKIYTPYISVVLYNMIGTMLPYEDIEEIVSDVFISLWNNSSYIDLSKGTIKSYIAATAKNFVKKKMRKNKIDYILTDNIEAIKNSTSLIDKSDMENFIWENVMSLGEPDNEIFIRYYKYGEKIKDISLIMGIKVSTIKAKLSRGKKKLKKIILEEEQLL